MPFPNIHGPGVLCAKLLELLAKDPVEAPQAPKKQATEFDWSVPRYAFAPLNLSRVPEPFRDLIRHMCAINKRKRPSALQVVKRFQFIAQEVKNFVPLSGDESTDETGEHSSGESEGEETYGQGDSENDAEYTTDFS